MVHDIATFGQEIGILTAYVVQHFLLRVASSIHQQLHVFGHTTSDHIKTQQVLVLVIGTVVAENLLDDTDGEGFQCQFRGGATIERFMLVLEDALHQRLYAA